MREKVLGLEDRELEASRDRETKALKSVPGLKKLSIKVKGQN